jgi:hypothetical protein
MDQRYEVWIAIAGAGALPEQVVVTAPDADSAILRAGMELGQDFADQAGHATVIDVRDEQGQLAE